MDGEDGVEQGGPGVLSLLRNNPLMPLILIFIHQVQALNKAMAVRISYFP